MTHEDNLLSQFRESPPAGFGESLYAQLQSQEESPTMMMSTPKINPHNEKRLASLLTAAAALFIAVLFSTFMFIRALPAANTFGSSSPASATLGINFDQFSIGGVVYNLQNSSVLESLRTAHMTWITLNVTYDPEANLEWVHESIRTARANNLKILLITQPAITEDGIPPISQFNQVFINAYTRWLSELAIWEPDAIQIWNQPNLDRNWTSGKPSGTAYVELLQPAYTAIKEVNQEISVISAAPAPTGAETGFPDQIINDDRFMREMVAANGLESLDCVGMNYLEGIVPPDARAGDPRDNYRTRYLPTMIESYRDIIGDNIPLCITELGYANLTGYETKSPFFAWAEDTTNETQARWTAQALEVSYTTGGIPLVMVFAMDTNREDNAPLQYYSALRPDGDCYICDAVAVIYPFGAE